MFLDATVLPEVPSLTAAWLMPPFASRRSSFQLFQETFLDSFLLRSLKHFVHIFSIVHHHFVLEFIVYICCPKFTFESLRGRDSDILLNLQRQGLTLLLLLYSSVYLLECNPFSQALV